MTYLRSVGGGQCSDGCTVVYSITRKVSGYELGKYNHIHNPASATALKSVYEFERIEWKCPDGNSMCRGQVIWLVETETDSAN